MTLTPTLPVLRLDEVFAHALRGEPAHLVTADARLVRLPVEDWTRCPEPSDHAIVDLCEGATLDIGCGPGRLTAELAGRGHVALGIDVVAEAVEQTVRRGGTALLRDVFGPVPGEGRWRTALLADGNIGIGGDPVRLLRRVRRLLAQGGQVVAEVTAPGAGTRALAARLVCGCSTSESFAWATVDVDGVAAVAAAAGLAIADRIRIDERWVVVLRSGS